MMHENTGELREAARCFKVCAAVEQLSGSELLFICQEAIGVCSMFPMGKPAAGEYLSFINVLLPLSGVLHTRVCFRGL